MMKDGLSFFANNDGTGSVRLNKLVTAESLAGFNPDFGTSIYHAFIVGKLTGVNQFDKPTNTWDIYPNPSNTHFTISTAIARPHTIATLYSATGLVIRKYVLDATEHQIDCSDLAGGMYFLKIMSPETGSTSIQRLLLVK
jgi:hypothetical protein